MPSKVGSGNVIHRFTGLTPVIRRYVGTNKIWEHSSPPKITAFSVAPNNIDLDTRATGTIVFTLGVEGDRTAGSAQASNFLFESMPNQYPSSNFLNQVTSSGLSYLQKTSYGTRSIASSNIWSLWYLPNTYRAYFPNSFLKTKTPIAIEIDNSSYLLTYLSRIDNNVSNYQTGTISSSDRVSATDLTKAVNIELVDNEQVTLESRSSNRIFRKDYTGGGLWFNTIGGSNQWVIQGSELVGDKTPTHIILNGRPFPVSQSQTVSGIWFTSAVTDANFQASATKLSWSINIPYSDGTYWNNTRSHLFQSTASGSTLNAQVVRLPEGTNIGPTQVAANGADLDTTIPNIAQPNKPTSYRLIAHNAGGYSHRDTSVNVTKNPTITNLRRTNVVTRAGFSTYTFAFTVTGLPRPAVTFDFSNFAESSGNRVATTHFIQGSNPYTWNVSGWSVTFPNSDARSLTLTATNGSGSVTASLANINS